MAVKHGGKTLSENLALSCLPCNRHKGSDFATLDPNNGEIIRLFNPRLQLWDEHFTLKNAEIIGITDIGQATSRLLMFNTSSRMRSRQSLIDQNLYP
ncbi:HNH endonuclease [Anabaena lutea]|uniref:HNH endonuclease n=1 Tax=Anabaena lutea TaxID=212350 RepID=UPI0030DD4A13